MDKEGGMKRLDGVEAHLVAVPFAYAPVSVCMDAYDADLLSDSSLTPTGVSTRLGRSERQERVSVKRR